MAKIEELLAKGVVIPAPGSVEIGEEVAAENIAEGVVLHAGTKVYGEGTSIGPECELGAETPVAVEDCQLGRGVKLKGGYFSGAVFLDGSAMGSGAHVRAGTILEEGAEMAHTVGLKQTIFFPYCVSGSLINFCDVLMSGGTSRKVHSEIGSSYIHFNYTPRGDKATASLVGDVPRGVMLDQPPIFLGGQGGMAGPVRVEYGTVVAAGCVLRKDVLIGGQLVVPAVPRAGQTAFSKTYMNVGRVVRNCAIYLGNIAALDVWYRTVRKDAMDGTPWGMRCRAGALKQLAAVRKERMKRLEALVSALAKENREGVPEALAAAHAELVAAWPAKSAQLAGAGDVECPEREAFLAEWGKGTGGYVDRIHALSAEAKAAGTDWLQKIVDRAADGF